MFPGIWSAKSRGACLVTKITGSLSGRPKSLKRSRKSYGEKLAVVPYASTGTSYSKYKVSAFSGSYRIFSEQEFNKVTDTRPGKSPGFYFMNYTDWPIAYSIDQLGCLYYGIVPTGSKGKPGLRKVDTGAVWFTLRMHIQPDGKSPQSDWDCVEPVADLIGDVAMAIFTGGAATTAKLGAKAGVKAGIKAGIKKAAKGITLSMVKDYSKEQLGKLLKKSSSVVMYGQYAGYPWPTQCGTMPRYAITDGPKVFLDRTGNAYIGQNVPFKVKKTNTCGNKMMSSSATQVTGEVGVFKKAQPKKKKKKARRISTASKKIKWFKFKGSLRNAFIGGGRPADKKRRLKRHKYAVCRGSYKKGIHPGKVHRGKCYIGYGGKEIVLRSFEVLSKRGRGNKFTWVKLRQARGKRKVIGGKEKNRSLAICRGRYKGGVHPGKLIRKKCNFGYWGKEIVLRKFEVLIKK